MILVASAIAELLGLRQDKKTGVDLRLRGLALCLCACSATS